MEKEHNVERAKDCIKKFCESLREDKRATGIKRKCKNLLYLSKKNQNKYAEDKKYHEVGDHCYYTGEDIGSEHGICNLKYSVAKKTPIAFHNGSNYYHFS